MNHQNSRPTRNQIDQMFELMQQKFQDSFQVISNNQDEVNYTQDDNVNQQQNQVIIKNQCPDEQEQRQQENQQIHQQTMQQQQYDNDNDDEENPNKNDDCKQQNEYQQSEEQAREQLKQSVVSILNDQDRHNNISQTYHKYLHQTPQHKLQYQSAQTSSTLDYKDLQYKLSSLLAKKNGINQNNSLNLNKSVNSLQMLSRFEDYQRKRQKQIQQKKQQIKQRQSKQLQFKPKLNKKSVKILQEIGHQSIQNRTIKILQQKNKKLKEYSEMKKLEQVKKYQEYLQEFKKYEKKQSERSYDQFYEEMLKWKLKAQKAIEEKKQQELQKQLKDAFVPKINKKSEMIMKKNEGKRLPVHERQIPGEKKIKANYNDECTFKPRINKQRVK